MSLEVVNAGFLALVQDFGRYGLQKYGITNGGPLDEHAYLWANHLLGNHYNASQIEISFGGFSCRFTKKTMIAVCGADLSATLNGQPLGLWQSHYVKSGDELKFVSPKSGLRSYLAVKGGFQIETQLTSCATVVREKLGGLSKTGEKLSDNDCLPFHESKEELNKRVPKKYIPAYGHKINLRFIANQSVTGCKAEVLKQFIGQPFKVTPNIDRMGYRLSGEPIVNKQAGIISQGLALGAIQLPKDGQPIVLMRDRQTMGGYPQLGCVAYLDIPLLAQSMPGTEVSFSSVAISDIEEELRRYKRFFGVNV